MSIVLKELKESRVCLKVLDYADLGDQPKRKWLLDESVELAAIGAKMIRNKQ